MKKLMMLAMMLGVALALQGALKDDIPDDYGLKEELTSQTVPGTPLKNNTIYTVRGHAFINAKANAGMSALKVPVGTQAVIEIPKDCSLTVIGGDAEGMIGAGAGIEVPAGAKLIICGEGELTAVGGNAAPGGDGQRGSNGEVTPLIDLKTFPKSVMDGKIGVGDVLGMFVGAGDLAKALESMLFVGKGGSGGAGGDGGGGAAAAIGGKGGRGGRGGAETVGQRVVPTSQWGKRKDQFEEWFDALGWESPYVYGYSTWNVKSKARALNGATGSRGAKGSNGMPAGEIIIAESVKISAQPGFGSKGGKNGTFGKPYSVYDMDHDNTQIMDFVVLGVQIGAEIAVTVMSGGANKAAEAGAAAKDAAETAGKIIKPDPPKEDDDGSTEEDEEDEDTTQKLWFYGGGGGGGGAGGAAALTGIGPGGAGGGGGGAGGSGLFIVGSNLGDPENEALGLEANGHGGLGGEAYVPAGADAAQVRASAFGREATALNKGESIGIPGAMEDALDECFNLYTNYEAATFWQKSGIPERTNDCLRLGCWTTNYEHDHLIVPELKLDCFAYAGLPGLGGKAGQVSTDYTIYKASTAQVSAGLDPSKATDYSGKVICRLKLVIGSGQADSEDYYLCGTVVAPCVIPGGSDGWYFAGYFDKPAGKGRQYFDKFGNPSGFPFIEGDTTLYAHWVTEDVDLGIRECKYVTDLNFGKVGATLETGRVYYFLEDIERNADDYGMKSPAVRIANNPGETVIFYIPEGVTVSFTGASGGGKNPGFAGIEVPAGVTLVVTGEGTLEATGGDAGSARDGSIGGDGGYISGKTDSVYGGVGSYGGAGAGGAAAAIGGSGGAGGDGGGMTAGNTVHCDGGDTKKNGNGGKSGIAGQPGGACGNVCLVGTVSLVLQGGAGAAGGGGGKAGAKRDDKGSGNAQNYTGTGGGGGGGGGGSYSALTIGGGQGGGGGGGGGGSGSTMNNDVNDVDGGTGQGGYGGSPAAGYPGGTELFGDPYGRRGDDTSGKAYHRNEVFGGGGGAAGAAGATGANGKYSRGLNLSVTAPEYGDRETVVGDAEYVFGHPVLQRTITFTYQGVKIGTVLAMMGEPLPTVIVDRLATVKGYDFYGAYRLDADGLPVLDEFGFEDWWYDEFGYGEKTYDAPGDVTLEVLMEPKWYAMADWPDVPEITYDGREHGVRDLLAEGEGYTVVGGPLVATNAGIYSVQLKLKDGYEVWSDCYWNDEPEVTNDVRTWCWIIQPADVGVKLENQNYDWNSTNAAFRLSGTVPGDMVASFWISGMYAPGVFEITADIMPKGEDFNHLPKELTAVFTIPPAIDVENVLPFYPWDTRVALDITLVDEFAESILTRYTNVTVRALTEIGECLDVNSTNVVTLDTFPVSELSLGYGTVIVDMKDARPASRGKVYVWLAIDDMPASEVFEVDADTTARANESGTLVYKIDDAREVYPINYSWRFANGDWNYTDPVRISVDGSAYGPLGEQGYASNEGSTELTIDANGRYAVGLLIGNADESGNYPKGSYKVLFEVNDPALNWGGEDPAPQAVKVIRNLESKGMSIYGEYTSLAAAVADYRYGDRFYICGDVQSEDVEIPSGALVILGDTKAKIRVPRPNESRPWIASKAIRDESGNIYGYEITYDAASRASFGPDADGEYFRYEIEGNETNLVFSVTNTYEGLSYVVDYKAQEADEWNDGTLTPGSNGVTYVAAPYLGTNGLYRPRVTDDPTEYSKLVYSENADGTLTVTDVKDGGIVDGALKIPSRYNGREVVAIARNALGAYYYKITSVSLPMTIRDISAALGSCMNLTEIEIPNGVKNLEEYAFSGCTKLKRVILPSALVSIGKYAFTRCLELEELELPASLETIDSHAFEKCGKLKAITIPDNVTKVADYAFEGCTNLTKVTLSPSSKLEIFDYRSFYGCEKLSEVTMPPSVNSVYQEAFSGCKALKFVEFQAAEINVGIEAFANSGVEAVYFHGEIANYWGTGMFPSDAKFYVKASAKNFGTVPGTWTNKGGDTYETVLWPDTLSVGHVFLDALRANGQSYIRTGYLHKENTKVVCRVSVPEADKSNATIFGGGATSGNARMAFRTKHGDAAKVAYLEGSDDIVYGDSEHAVYGEPFPYAPAADMIRTVELTCSKDGAFWSGDGCLISRNIGLITPGNVENTDQDIIVFAQNDGYGGALSETKATCTLGWLKIYETDSYDVLVRDFRPCKNLRTGELGLFDIADNDVDDGNRFCKDEGSKLEEVCARMPEPDLEFGEGYSSAYTRMEEVRVTGEQYLNLDYTPPQGATVQLIGGIDGYTPEILAEYGKGQGSTNAPAAIRDLFIYENGRLVRHYVPSERKDGFVKGLYELYTKAFVENAGGSYILPRLPAAYQEVEYIRKPDTYVRYIYTDYRPNVDSDVKVCFKLGSSREGSVGWIFGRNDGYDRYGIGVMQNRKPVDSYAVPGNGGWTSKDGSYWALFGSIQYIQTDESFFKTAVGTWKEYAYMPENQQITIEMSAERATYAIEDGRAGALDPLLEGSAEYVTVYSTDPITIFGYHPEVPTGADDDITLYSLSISELGVLKLDMVPCCEKATGRHGLWDTVEKKFYWNAWKDPDGITATPDFESGPDVMNR